MNYCVTVNSEPMGCWPDRDLAEWHAARLRRMLPMATVEVVSDEIDPTPWCHQCGAQTEDRCECGPIADNN